LRGRGTQSSPDHHKHQTGLYCGFTRVNGRDYFHHPEGDYWRRVAAEILEQAGESVRWRTVYDLRQAVGAPVTIEKADIQSRESPKVSMMPEGMLAGLEDGEVVALIRYLRTTQALPEK